MKLKINKILEDSDSYFKWRLERVKNVERRFPEIFDVKGKKALDVGCGGEAPLSYYLSEVKKAEVFAGDINNSIIDQAKKFTRKPDFRVFSSEKLPFKKEQFDFVYLFDILEHVRDPLKTLKEAKRVLKKEGTIFVEFSPYYAYPTGHHLYYLGFPMGFLPFQFLPRSLARYLIFNSKVKIRASPERIFADFRTLNKITVSKFKRIIKEANLKVVKEYNLIMMPHKEINISFLGGVPLFREVITMSYSAVLKK